MLRANLATRPFYNVRAVRSTLAFGVALVVGITALNLGQFVRLTVAERSLGNRAASAESEAVRLREEAARLRTEIDPAALKTVIAAADEANAILDQRAFSWTALLRQFEGTLPPDVRITAIRPRVDRSGQIAISAIVEARRVEDLDAFLEALEQTGAFGDVLPTEVENTESGLVAAAVSATYLPPAAERAGGALE